MNEKNPFGRPVIVVLTGWLLLPCERPAPLTGLLLTGWLLPSGMRIHVSAPLPNRLTAPSNMERSDILKATQKRDSSEQRESGAWRMTSERVSDIRALTSST